MLSLREVDEKYSNISYNVWGDSLEPDKGYLNYTLLLHNVRISTYIDIKESLLNDYKHGVFMLAFKHVKNRHARKNAYRTFLLRELLEQQIIDYLSLVKNTEVLENKILLLNDKTLDKHLGDMGIQSLFRFEKHDGTHEFFLAPGEAARCLSSMIGLGVFDAPSIEEVLEDIINKMLDLLFTNVISNTKLANNQQLKDDVTRYLKLCVYGV